MMVKTWALGTNHVLEYHFCHLLAVGIHGQVNFLCLSYLSFLRLQKMSPRNKIIYIITISNILSIFDSFFDLTSQHFHLNIEKSPNIQHIQ